MYPNVLISSTLSIPTYFLIVSLTSILAILWTAKRAKKLNLSVKNSLDLCLLVMISGLVGARLFHILFENPTYYLNSPLKVFTLWEGGFVFYGGLISSMLVGYFYISKVEPNKKYAYLDLAAPIGSLSYLLGRIACFFAGCCFGKSCSLPWAIQGLHPTQLYAVALESVVLFVLLASEGKNRAKPKGDRYPTGSLFLMWLNLHACGRLIMEMFRDDFRGPIFIFSVSSWISIVIILVTIILLRKITTYK